MWDETAGERGPELNETTSWPTPTEDPNCTFPLVSGATAGPKATERVFDDGDSRYRILGPLGEGGMGIVYRAEDTRLGRTVAIKTIPAERTANQRAKERFLNEARAASALDHPNLCTVYEIEETPSGRLYLFMPCYDGETLRDRLRRGPLPLKEAVHIAQQVARGLAKAHRQGIVHCDVKPANLMLTADGVVKILDFGIARLSGKPPVQAGPSGTPMYRSPEQARGGEVGAASDVWSLGMVLYEMVTGEPPQRDEQGRVWHGDAARRLQETPTQLDGILCRMLAYAPADRYPNAAALLADLDRLEKRERRAGLGRKNLLVAGIVSVVLGLAILSGFLTGRRSGSALRPTLVQLTDFPGKASYPSLSPDGSTVLYVRSVGGRSHIFSQRSIAGAKAVDLTADSLADDTQPAFSPDGKQIAFRSEREGGGIFLMSSQGGPVRRLTTFGFNPAWSPDGREIACATESIVNPQLRRTNSEIFRVDVMTGMRRQVTRGDAVQPSWSPHSRRIAYWGLPAQAGRRVIWTVPAGGGEATRTVDDGHFNWNPVWSPDGRYLYFASDRSGIMNLWRIPIDEESGQTLGEPSPVTTSQQAAVLPGLSGDGRQIAYASDGTKATLEKFNFDPARGMIFGLAGVIVQTSGVIAACDASPDGKWLAYQSLTPREELYVGHPDGSGWRRLLGDEHKNRMPVFSPGSSRIAFYSNRSGKYEIWSIGIDDHRLMQETSIPGKPVSTPLWSPDGKMLALGVQDREAVIDLTRTLNQRLPQFLPKPSQGRDFVADSWSPDGRLLAGAEQPQGGPRYPGIVLYSLADKRYTRFTSNGDSTYWLHDNRRLLYSVRDRFFLLDTRTGRSQPVPIPSADPSYMDICLSPDDRVLYATRTIPEGHIWLLELGSE